MGSPVWVLHAALVPRLYNWGMKEVEFSWVLESNHLSKRTLERGGALVTKKYRIYQDDSPSDAGETKISEMTLLLYCSDSPDCWIHCVVGKHHWKCR